MSAHERGKGRVGLFLDRHRPTVNKFFKGRLYPVLLGIAVVLGHISGLELYFAAINIIAISIALYVGDSFLPALPFACTAVFHMSRINTMGDPAYSDYFLHPARIAVFFLLVILLASAIVFYFVKTKLYREISYRRMPLFVALSVLSIGFLMNGAFSGLSQAKDILYAALECVCYWFLFVIFYCGLKRERAEDLVDSFVYTSIIMAGVLIAEMAYLYLFGGVITDGAIVKEKILFGWGIWNTMGVYLAVLIPVCFLGAIRGKRPLGYFILATVTLGATFLTLSRNAILFGSIAYAASVIICCFKGKSKKLFRIILAVGIVLVGALAVLLWDKITTVFGDLFARGFSDNGRFDLWKAAFDRFLANPIFGSGFYSFKADIYAPTTFLPTLAHQTVLEILSAMGIFGLLCYAFYRYSTLKPFFTRPSTVKTFLLMSILVMLGESLLDNFVFHFHHVIHYSAALAIAFRLSEDETECVYKDEKR